jgi:hypothetical protein
MSRLPWFVKRYAERLPVTPLPRELPGTAEPAVTLLAGTTEVTPAPLDLPNLSRLLYLSAGVVRTMERDYGIHPFRAAGSAGGRFPLELYVAVPPGGALPAGVHWYDPLEHALIRVGPPPHGAGPAVLVTGIPLGRGARRRRPGTRCVPLARSDGPAAPGRAAGRAVPGVPGAGAGPRRRVRRRRRRRRGPAQRRGVPRHATGRRVTPAS